MVFYQRPIDQRPQNQDSYVYMEQEMDAQAHKVGNTTISLSNSAKFLGVTLDNKLNYNKHISNIT